METSIWQDLSSTENWDDWNNDKKYANYMTSKQRLIFYTDPTLHKLPIEASWGSSVPNLVRATREKAHRFKAEEREINEVGTISAHQASPSTGAVLPTVLSPRTTSPPPTLRRSTDSQTYEHHDQVPTQANYSRRESPSRRFEPDIELDNLSSGQAEEPPPPEGELRDIGIQRIEERAQSVFWLSLCGIAIFLAPVDIVLGMTAINGDYWKLTFVGFFILWLLVWMTWLFIDVYGLDSLALTKRCLWHLGGCIASLYFFMSISHLKSDDLPPWLPTILDCGLGVSLGFQKIPGATKSITNVIGSVFGGIQVTIRRDEQRLLQEEEPTSSRSRMLDVETGSVV